MPAPPLNTADKASFGLLATTPFYLMLLFRRNIRAVKGALRCALFLLGMPLSLVAQEYNLKTGPVLFNLEGVFGIEYNSNINASGRDPQSDVILSPGLRFAGQWEISRVNTLRLAFEARYEKYLDHDELDSSRNFLTLDPDSRLAFDILVGEHVLITLSDSFSFTSDPTDAAIIREGTDQVDFDVFSYGRFRNEAAVAVSWDISATWRAVFVGSRADVVPLDDEFDYLERTQYAMSGQLWKQVNADLSLAGVVTAYTNSYVEHFQRDSDGTYIGGRGLWQISEYISLEAGAGVRTTDFEEMGENEDQTDFDSVVGDLSLAHTLNSRFSHRISYVREFDYGYIANFREIDRVGYGFKWLVLNRHGLDGFVWFEEGQDSGGLAPEDYDRWSLGMGTRSELSTGLTVGVSYRYTTKDSNLPNRSYHQHRALVDFRYDF